VTPSRRRWLLLLGLAAVAAGLAAALWPRGAPPDVAAAPPSAPDSVRLEVSRAATPVEEAPEAVQRYLEANVYPPNSGRLDPGDASLLEPNRRYEGFRPIRETLGDPDRVVSYEFSADRFDVTGDDPVEVWIEAKRGRAPLPLEWIEGEVQREGRAGLEGDPVDLAFAFDGTRWEAELPLDELADHYGFLVATARFGYGDGRRHEDTLRFFHTPEGHVPARFTGRFHDYVRDGGLTVEVGLDVEVAGFYRLDANFYDVDGAPTAYASFKGELAEGSRMIPLSVYGKVLRDADARAPYTLRELRGYRFVDGAYPDRETIPPAPFTWITGRYAPSEFTEEAWDSEHKRRMVELMLEDEAAGIPVEVPPLAAGGVAPPEAPGTPELP
jgi:hypothetical protein